MVIVTKTTNRSDTNNIIIAIITIHQSCVLCQSYHMLMMTEDGIMAMMIEQADHCLQLTLSNAALLPIFGLFI
jgi:hypothetical protein